jgi:hypothetical protein
MKIGDKIIVKLFNGRVVSGAVRRIEPTVSGPKIRILSGQLLLNVTKSQIVKV